MGVFAAAVVLTRTVWLGRFPEVSADEGLWTNSSKNFVLFGDWFMDGRTHLFLSPLYSALCAVAFTGARPSIAAARWISAGAGLASIMLLWALVRRLSARLWLATVTAVVFGLNEFTIIIARRALTEPVELATVLGAALLLTRPGVAAAAVAGVVFGAALLTKINCAFAGVILVIAILAPAFGHPRRQVRGELARVAAFGLAAVAVSGIVYGALYGRHPALFVQAFRFELDGVHFEGLSHPLIREGRFGLDPSQSARTALRLFREAPFLLVLSVMGVVVAAVRRQRGAGLFATWLAIGLPYFLGQIYQDLRYFYLLTPALAFFAALAMMPPDDLEGDVRASTIARGLLAMYAAFEFAYIGGNGLANQARKLPAVVDWARAHTQRDDRILAAGYFATDLPNRTYAYYKLARDTTELLRVIRRLDIAYTIYDSSEWPPDFQRALAAHFPVVQRWPFGAVYATSRSLTPPDVPKE